jgi:alpha-tubulin suppressor-like RCC1 family protein
VPPGGECNPNATRCASDAQQTCGADGKWGAAVACDIACDAAGSACVVPVQLAAGSFHTCALLSDGTVRCWGSNYFGQLGNNTTADAYKPQPVPDIQGATAIAAGQQNTCAILADKTASCWGANGSGQIGSGGSPALLPVKLNLSNVVKVGVGGDAGSMVGGDSGHLCAVVESGGKSVVKCIGSNGSGQLGGGSKSSEPVRSFVDVGGLVDSVERVSLGFRHTCVVTKTGAVFCWGANDRGQVDGSESTSPVLQPRAVSAVAGSVDVQTNSSLYGYTCALKGDGVAFCWGSAAYGQLGGGQNHLPSNGQTPAVVQNLGDIKQVDTSNGHACALKKDGTVWCWGANNVGQLGVDCSLATCDFADESGGIGFDSDYAKVPQLARMSNAEEIVAGDGNTTCARTTDHKVLCWGDNRYGQLGLGQTTKSTSTPTPVVWK